MKKINKTDKIIGILLILTAIFWVLSKIPVMYNFIPFDIIYQAGWLIAALATLGYMLYFLYRWNKEKFTFSTISFYGFLLGVFTLIFMRFY